MFAMDMFPFTARESAQRFYSMASDEDVRLTARSPRERRRWHRHPLFEPLRIPPLIGWGTGVDCTMLVAGLLFLVARLVWKRETKAKKSPD
jgi:hypothetical protein